METRKVNIEDLESIEKCTHLINLLFKKYISLLVVLASQKQIRLFFLM